MTVETFELRDYQQETIDDLYRLWGMGWRRIVGVMPTGGGKTVLGVKPVADCIAAGRRVLWLAHRTELIDAAEEKLKADSSGLSVGVLQGTRRQFDRHVIVASVQTAVRPAALAMLGRLGIGLIVIDECHHSVAPSYMTIMRELGALSDDGPRVLGLTATLGRADGLALSELWQAVAKPVEMGRLIRDGWLLQPRGIRVKVEGLDFRQVRKSRGESGLDDGAVARAMSESLAPAAIARAVVEHCAGRRGVAFLPSVELSKEQARVFCEHGLRAVHIDADTPKEVRRELMRRAKAGAYDVVCNVGLFTEGTDVPIWSYAVLGRPTSSEVLFTQMIGRPLRPYPEQVDALLLDVVGITGRHRIRSIVDLEGVPMVDEIPDDLAEYLDDDAPADDEPREAHDADPTPEGADGQLVVELVDLFSASHTAWQQSPRGVWFLPTGNGRAVFLAPGQEPGTYDVRWSSGELVHEDSVPLDAAMTWGEKAAKSAAARPVEREAKWRKRKATLADKWAALSAGARPDEFGREAGGVTDVLDRQWAGNAIDLLPCVEQVTPAGYWTTY